MQIRKAKQEEAAAIGALLARSYPALMRQSYAPEVLAIALPLMIRPNAALIASGRFYVAEADGAIQGCGGWSFETPGSGALAPGLIHARHFAVDPQRGGLGIGRALFERAAQAAMVDGASRVQAFASLNAEAFYRRMGLRRLALRSLPMSADVSFPIAHMEGPLPPPPGGR